MTVGFNRKWISCAAILLILSAAAVLGIYTTLTKDIMIEDRYMTDNEKRIELLLFSIIGAVALTALIKLIFRITHKKVCFTIDENGISNTVVLFNIFALFFVFNIKYIPWKAIKSIEKEEFKNLVHARISKEYINEITASPLAKAVLKHTGYWFCSGLADMPSDDIIDICNKYRQ